MGCRLARVSAVGSVFLGSTGEEGGMNLVRQPEGSSLCGQACVAMVAGVTLDESVSAVGHKHGTYTREIVKALRALGVPCPDRLRRVSRVRPVLPQRAIVAVVKWATRPDGKRKQRRAHWMVAWDGVIYDPEDSWPALYERNGWTITSYLELPLA
jgi:hypothetical protein